MSKTFGDLKLLEKFPAKSLLKLAENRFKEKPFTCRQIYDAHIDYYGKEHRKLKHVASSIANLMHSNHIIKENVRTVDNLSLYRLTGKAMEGRKEIRQTKDDVFNVIKENYLTKEFTSSDISKYFDNRNVSFHIRSLKNEGKVRIVGRSFKGMRYRYVIDLKENNKVAEEQQPIDEEQQPIDEEQQPIDEEQQPIDEEQRPIETKENQTINKEMLQSLDVPIELIGESIVMNINTLKRKIDDLEVVENSWKRQVDDLNKTIKSQSRIIENLNVKIGQLNSEKYKSKNTTVKLGEIARISVLKNPKKG